MEEWRRGVGSAPGKRSWHAAQRRARARERGRREENKTEQEKKREEGGGRFLGEKQGRER